ncbi:MAG: serine/threonine protein kinase [Kiritimatiellae bacterium]|nr:serine/threonine protein kinase [Kiritimatiellia bacterium]
MNPEENSAGDTPPDIPGLRIESIAGRGGMSIVYKAWHFALGKYVAVKVMDSRFNASARDVRQFIIEAKAMSEVDHPNIVHAMEADCVDGRYYFIMDFVGGYTFGELIARKEYIVEHDALIVAETVGEAMNYAWRSHRMVHCDIKPENIMVDVDGSIKLTDLGIAQAANIASVAESDEVTGTPAYISPEQVLGEALDQRSDIYSLGATLYHLACGRMPFPGLSNDDTMRAHVEAQWQAPDPRTIQPMMSEGFVRLLAKAMVKNRKNRYQSWDGFLDDVRLVYRCGIPEYPQGVISSIAI